jgi:hypothetical protein
MPYEPSDPRATLPKTEEKPISGRFTPTHYARFYETPPQAKSDGVRTWLVRGQNFVVAYSSVETGAMMSRREQPDEYVLLLPDPDMAVEIVAGDQRARIGGHSITFIPPGDSDITCQGAGRLVRLLTTRSGDLAAICSNASAFGEPDPRIPPLQDWPAPTDGFRIRSYTLDVVPEPGRFGRIFRCTTFMVNYADPAPGRRDPTRLAPHHHDDFEQCSLVVDGSYTHHIRWPWTTDMTAWREDEHEFCRAPSAAIIPPPAIHASRAEEAAQMVDIFCPPRVDFSGRPGWVLNADDYPTRE